MEAAQGMACHSVRGLPLSVSELDQKESGSVCLEQGPSVLPCVSLARSGPPGALVSGQQRLGEVAGGSPRTVAQAVRVLRQSLLRVPLLDIRLAPHASQSTFACRGGTVSLVWVGWQLPEGEGRRRACIEQILL